MSDMTRKDAIEILQNMLAWMKAANSIVSKYDRIEALEYAIASLETDETYQLEYERPAKNDLGVDWDELKRKIFMEVDGGTDDKWLRYVDVCDNISNSIDEFKAELPSVTPQEPKTGHWIMTSDYLTTAYGSIDYVKCSCCGEDSLEEGDYCPNCGADMRGTEE